MFTPAQLILDPEAYNNWRIKKMNEADTIKKAELLQDLKDAETVGDFATAEKIGAELDALEAANPNG